ncbi:hypothetical protein JTB14_033983 [Gonioctena quinquepunctata]|nr:hypothetical protein JTB14_033983 [Gonioctena quinquepunctata]
MNISCVICSDLFLPGSEVHSTTCGHMFHYTCLMNWLERSKSCPQCRSRVTESTIHRLFFNLANTDAGQADVGTLVNQVENLQFKISLNEKNNKKYREKIHKLESQTRGLREEVSQLENKEKVHESAIHALKDQIAYFKGKAKESDQLSAEIVRLKNSMKNMDNIQLAINGTRDQVNEILRNEHNMDSLALLVATLKKALLDSDKYKRDAEISLKRAKFDANKYKKEYLTLDCHNSELRRELHQLKAKYEKEKQQAKHKIAEKKLMSDETVDITGDTSANDSLICLISPYKKNDTPKNTSLPVAEKVQQILNSDSPYLPVKTNATSIDYASSLNARFQTGLVPSHTSYSIFKSNSSKPENTKIARNLDVSYNGLGGSSKDDIYPSPKPAQTGLKRQKSSTAISSVKFRKLTAAPSSKK